MTYSVITSYHIYRYIDIRLIVGYDFILKNFVISLHDGDTSTKIIQVVPADWQNLRSIQTVNQIQLEPYLSKNYTFSKNLDFVCSVRKWLLAVLHWSFEQLVTDTLSYRLVHSTGAEFRRLV